MDDLDTPLFVHGRVMQLTQECLYLQGLLPDNSKHDLDFYLDFFNPRLATIIVNNRSIQRAIAVVRKLYPWGTMIVMTTQIFIIIPVDMILHLDDKALVGEGCYALLLCCLVFSSLISVLFSKEEFKSFFVRFGGLIQNDERVDEADPKNWLVKLEKWNSYINQLNLKLWVPSFVTALVGYTVLTIHPRRKFFTCGWYPYDAFASPAYEMTLFVWFLETILLFFLSNTLTILGVFTSLYLKIHFDNLCFKLKHIRQISIRRVHQRKRDGNVGPNVQRLRHLQVLSSEHAALQIVDPKLRQGIRNSTRLNDLALFNPSVIVSSLDDLEEEIYVAHYMNNPNEHEMHPQMEGSAEREIKENKHDYLEGITAQELDKEMLFQQGRFVKLHQELISMSEEFGSLLNQNLMVLYAFNIICFALTAKMLQTSEEHNFKELMYVVVCSQLVVIYFLYNFLFNLITEGSEAVSEAVYESDWADASMSFKRSMIITMSRANVPVEFKPTGLSPLNLINFADVASASYKMLATFDSFM